MTLDMHKNSCKTQVGLIHWYVVDTETAAPSENDQIRTVQVVTDSDGLLTLAFSSTLGDNLHVTATSQVNLTKCENRKWSALPIGLHL